MTKGMRAALLGGAVVVAAGAGAYFFWPQGDRVTPGMGPYAREFDLCRRAIFEIDLRIGSKVEYIPRTEYYQAKGNRLIMGGQVNIQRSEAYPNVRNTYECEVQDDAMIRSKVAPVSSVGAVPKG
jgi:hypothetical protein